MFTIYELSYFMNRVRKQSLMQVRTSTLMGKSLWLGN